MDISISEKLNTNRWGSGTHKKEVTVINFRTCIYVTLLLLFLLPQVIAVEQAVSQQRVSQEQMLQRTLRLLEEGEYEKGLILADKLWAGWRIDVTSRLTVLLSSRKGSGISYGIDPKSQVISEQMRKDALAILGSIQEIKEVKAVPYLLNITDKELASHTYVAAYIIGTQQYETNKAACAEIVDKVLRAWEKIMSAQERMESIFGLSVNVNNLRIDILDHYLSGGSPELLLALYKDSRDWQMKITQQILRAATSNEVPINYSTENSKKYAKKPTVLLAALSDEDPHIRRYAAYKLGKFSHLYFFWEDEEGVQQALRELLKDKNFSIQVEAALSLVSYDSLDGLRYLISQDISELFHISEPNRYGSVWPAILKMGNLHFTESTLWIVKAGQQDPALRRICVDALWTMRDPAAFEFLGKIVLDKDEAIDLRTHALFPLARSMDNKAFPYIKKAYTEAVKAKNPQMISSCLAAMGDIHPDLSFDILFDANVIKQLNDDKATLKKGREVYWSDKRRLLNAWDRVRDARFVKTDSAKENVAWRELEKTVSNLSISAKIGGLQEEEFRWEEMVSRDGLLRIYKKVKDNGLFIIVEENRTAEQKDKLDKK